MSTKPDTKKEAAESLSMQQLKEKFTTEELNKVFILFPELLASVLISILPKEKEHQYIINDVTNKNQPKLIVPRVFKADSQEYTETYKSFEGLKQINGIALTISMLNGKAYLLILKDQEKYGLTASFDSPYCTLYLHGQLITKKVCELIYTKASKMPNTKNQLQENHIELIAQEIQNQAAQRASKEFKKSEEHSEDPTSPTDTGSPQFLLSGLGPTSTQAKLLPIVEKVIRAYSSYLEESCRAAWKQEVTRLREWRRINDPVSSALLTLSFPTTESGNKATVKIEEKKTSDSSMVERWIEMRAKSPTGTIVEPSSPIHQQRQPENRVETGQVISIEPPDPSDKGNTFG